MTTIRIALGVFSLALAGTVFLLGEGPRRWYSGIFFVLLGVVLLLNAGRGRRS
jgi:drug/metabolite transporter (DMT)-like permease